MKFKKSNYASEDAGRPITFSNEAINEAFGNTNDTKTTEGSASEEKKLRYFLTDLDFLELYGVVHICEKLKNYCCNEIFKRALYDNMHHFHKDADSYEKFDEKKYIINKWIAYERNADPTKTAYDIFKRVIMHLIAEFRIGFVDIFTQEDNGYDDMCEDLVFTYAKNILAKRDSEIIKYDLTPIVNSEYISEIGYAMRWRTSESIYKDYFKKYMPEVLNDKYTNTSDTSKDNTKKRIYDLEVYGTICICKTFNDPDDFEYFEPFKHALYDNMCHFHEDTCSYEDFDETGYIINKYAKYEMIKNPETHICDILEPLFMDIIDSASAGYLMSSTGYLMNLYTKEDKRQILNGIAFGFACDKLSKDESRIVDYDLSDICDEQYPFEVEFVMKWALRSTHDEYVKKYAPKSLNNPGDNDVNNTAENTNNSTKIQKGDK